MEGHIVLCGRSAQPSYQNKICEGIAMAIQEVVESNESVMICEAAFDSRDDRPMRHPIAADAAKRDSPVTRIITANVVRSSGPNPRSC